jgi:hypothetical protein
MINRIAGLASAGVTPTSEHQERLQNHTDSGSGMQIESRNVQEHCALKCSVCAVLFMLNMGTLGPGTLKASISNAEPLLCMKTYWYAAWQANVSETSAAARVVFGCRSLPESSELKSSTRFDILKRPALGCVAVCHAGQPRLHQHLW